MATLEEDFPELLNIEKSVQVFKLGEEPPAWKDHEHQTPAQRWRNAEILRRMVHDYDPDSETVPHAVQAAAGQ